MDSKSAFIKRFGDLIALLRVDPGNDAAQDLALAASTAAVEDEPLDIEAGVEWNVIPDDLTLKGRLLARQVELIRIAAGAEPDELLALARALSHDLSPIPSSAHIDVEMVQLLAPPPDPHFCLPSTPGLQAIEHPRSTRKSFCNVCMLPAQNALHRPCRTAPLRFAHRRV